MYRASRTLLLLLCCCAPAPALAQLPFYTDDPAVTDRGTLHFEFFDEFDNLQNSQYPNLQQNTANFKLNYGLPYRLELDIDAPYLSIYRALAIPDANGTGDTNMGVKCEFRGLSPKSHSPALAASLYIEFPTGDERQQLGSGLTDYWLNFIGQVPLSEKTRITANAGFLFAGNTSTGVVGITTRHGHVYTGGVSLLHDLTPRLTLGAEAYGGRADTNGLGRTQLQVLVGGMYELKSDLSFTFAALGGKYEASPRIGGQVGFAVDFPNFLHRPSSFKTPSGNPGIDPSLNSTSSQRRSQ